MSASGNALQRLQRPLMIAAGMSIGLALVGRYAPLPRGLREFYLFMKLCVRGAGDAVDDLLLRGRNTYQWKQKLEDIKARKGITMPPKGSWAVVTGANSGIGFELAGILSQTGVNVVLACRNEQRGKAAERKLKEMLAASNKSIDELGQVEFAQLDVSDLASVSVFAKVMESRRVALLVCNAALSATPWRIGPQGYEEAFTVNHLGHALLSQLMLPQLERSTPARIVFISSSTQTWSSTRLRLDLFAKHLPEPALHDKFHYYGDTKVTQACYALELSAKLSDKSQVVAHVMHPGCAETNITQAWPAAKLMDALGRPLRITPLEAASYVARVCLADDTAPAAGQGVYYHCAYPADPGRVASNRANCQKTFDLTLKVLREDGWLSA